MYKNIFLDLDEVLVDFVSGFGDHYGYDFEGLDGWNMEAHIGISKDEFYSMLNDLGHDFWANLDKHTWADDLVDLVESNSADVYIVSTPSQNPGAWSGKLEWVKKNLPAKYTHNVILTSDKHLLADIHSLLIDDKQKNINKFKQCDGWAIPFPQLWNDADRYIGSRLEYVKRFLEHKNM